MNLKEIYVNAVEREYKQKYAKVISESFYEFGASPGITLKPIITDRKKLEENLMTEASIYAIIKPISWVLGGIIVLGLITRLFFIFLDWIIG